LKRRLEVKIERFEDIDSWKESMKNEKCKRKKVKGKREKRDDLGLGMREEVEMLSI
jgi:hypothetical protein